MYKVFALLIVLLFLTGCNVNSVSFKIPDLEVERTDNGGFRVSQDNFTDILINREPTLPPVPEPAILVSEPRSINETVEVEVSNNSITLSRGDN